MSAFLCSKIHEWRAIFRAQSGKVLRQVGDMPVEKKDKFYLLSSSCSDDPNIGGEPNQSEGWKCILGISDT
jgi:hypothetical protein